MNRKHSFENPTVAGSTLASRASGAGRAHGSVNFESYPHLFCLKGMPILVRTTNYQYRTSTFCGRTRVFLSRYSNDSYKRYFLIVPSSLCSLLLRIKVNLLLPKCQGLTIRCIIFSKMDEELFASILLQSKR